MTHGLMGIDDCIRARRQSFSFCQPSNLSASARSDKKGETNALVISSD